MAESILFGIVETVVEKIGSDAVGRIGSAWALEKEMRKLEVTLSSITDVLVDAEEKQRKSQALRGWLEKLRDVCHDADDLLDEFQYQALQLRLSKNHGNIKTKVRSFFSRSNYLLLRWKMVGRIKAIRERLNKIAEDRRNFTLLEVEEPRVVHRDTHSFVRDSDVIGRDQDRENIVQLLIHSPHDPDERVSVLPIVGIGGLGKTTLAGLVYNDKRVVDHFQMRMWVCVSDDFDVQKIITRITGKESTTGATSENLEQSQSLLREKIKDKMFLLVLDDVWNEERGKWIQLENLLTDGESGSKIVVTTRSKKVASIMGTIPSHNLEGLTHKDCLSLFLKWAFKKGDEKQHLDLVAIGEEIANKCRGVPLAARTLGSLLFSKCDHREWERVRDDDLWKLEQPEDGILAALRLSYEQLPSYLRHCFAYCSIFPKDTVFKNTYLIWLWIAQGLIQSSSEDRNRDLEDIGLQYINDLLSRCFFQEAKDFGNYLEFKMHDLVHDLAVLVATTECAMINPGTQSIPRTVRHVSFCYNEYQWQQLPSFLLENKPRTILFPPNIWGYVYGSFFIYRSFVSDCISHVRSTRVLDLSGLDFGAVPNSISTLHHLRYLSLRGNQGMKTLPNSISKLLNLQTLLLGGCWQLEELPKDLGNMINLRHLEISTKQMFFPGKGKGIGCLNSLRFLSFFGCSNLEVLFEGMERLTALRTLLIIGCRRLVSLPHSLKRLRALETLIISNSTLDFVDGEDEVEGFPRIHLLQIELVRLQVLPGWIQNLKSLEILRIRHCPMLSTLSSEELHRLTSLKTLEIKDCPSLRDEWHKTVNVSNLYIDGKKIKSSTTED